MKTQLTPLLLPLVLLAACNNKRAGTGETPVSHVSDTMVVTPLQENRCYRFATAKDTVELHLTLNDSAATGSLSYHLAEKDRNEGTINGTMKGDTLKAEYRYHSEGVESVREVIFLQRGNDLQEGTGTQSEHEGKMVFNDPASISFNGLVLGKVDCPTP